MQNAQCSMPNQRRRAHGRRGVAPGHDSCRDGRCDERTVQRIRLEVQRGIDQAEAGLLRDGEVAFRELREKLGLR